MGGRVIVVTVARRPVAESNVASNTIAHECGGYNIEGTRVEGAPAVPGSDGAKGVDSHVYATGLNATAARRAAFYTANPPSGRWPANLVLQHKAGCRYLGTNSRKFKGLIVRRKEKSAEVGVYSPGVAPAGVVVSPCVGTDGKETVASWDCAPGCPVATLDSQSGDLAPQGAQKKLDTGDKSFLGTGHGGATDSTFYGDRGGASRFFKQVKGGLGHG